MALIVNRRDTQAYLLVVGSPGLVRVIEVHGYLWSPFVPYLEWGRFFFFPVLLESDGRG